jgi:tRNA (guanine-N7-)-methyltransferase
VKGQRERLKAREFDFGSYFALFPFTFSLLYTPVVQDVAYHRPTEFDFPDAPSRLYPTNPAGLWHLEVGFGDGRFWAEQHKLELGVNYLGVEISGVAVQKAISRYRGAGVKRAVIARLAAEWVVQHVVPVRALERVYINFPDPWPKTRHEESRLLRPSFLEMLTTRLTDSGEVWLTTDHPGYLEFALESAQATKLYEITRPEPPAAALQTKYAMRWQGMGLPVFHARFRKIAESKNSFTPIERFEMPHAVMTGDLPTTKLEKIVRQDKNYTVILFERYLGDNRVMVLARTEETDFIQEVLIAATKRTDGQVVVGLEPFGSPLITVGVKAAVGAVADWLETQGMTVLRRAH